MPRVGLRVAHGVHEQIRTAADYTSQGCVVTTFGDDEPCPGFRQFNRHFSAVPACDLHDPAGSDQPPRDGAPEDTGTSKDHSPFHGPTLAEGNSGLLWPACPDFRDFTRTG